VPFRTSFKAGGHTRNTVCLLLTLLEAGPVGLPASRPSLLSHVWGREYLMVERGTVDVHIASSCRKALTSHGGIDPIRTVRGWQVMH